MLRTIVASLRARLILLVLVAMLPAAGLILYNSWEQRQDAAEDVRQDASALAQLIAGHEAQLIEGARQLLGTLAALTAASDPASIDPAQCSAAFASILAENERYANIGMANEEGTIFCSGLPSPPVDASWRTWFERATETRAFAVGDRQIGTITGEATVNFGYPVLGEGGDVQAVIFAALRLDWLNELAAQSELPEAAALTVIDGRGVILARHPEPDRWVGRTIPEEDFDVENAATTEVRGPDGIERLFAFAPLDADGGSAAYVRVGIPKDRAFAAVNQTLTRNLALLGGAAGLTTAAAWFFGDLFVARRVRALLRAARRIASGDLTARTGSRSREGELGELEATFDEMANAVERRHAERAAAEAALAAKAAELERSNKELQQFAYVASHDLQEPLRMVASYTQLLAQRYRGKLDSEADEFIEFAVDGADRMQRLINDLLAYSRVGTRGKDPAPTDAETVLNRCLSDLQRTIEESDALVEHEPLPAVQCDDVQLGQLFQNLIANAIKFRGEAPPRIQVAAEQRNGQCLFSVSDNGIGIDPAHNGRIFDIFQRLHGRGDYPGTGIGLAICKRIVERHGGTIWVDSQPGKGATFYFSLPAARSATREES